MARTRRNLDARGEAAQVLQRLKREPAGWRRERLLAVKLGLEGQLDLEEIAACLGRARSCIQGWLDRFRRGGLPALLQPPQRGQGPASQLSPELAQALHQKLAAGEFRSQGGTWIIPGHGRLSDSADVASYRNMLVIIRDRMRNLMDKGKTLQQIQAARPSYTLTLSPLAGPTSWTIVAVRAGACAKISIETFW